MAKSIISEGKTTNEAIEKGLKQLNVSKKMVDIKVLESEDKRSFFSILAPRVVKVEMTLKEKEEEETQTKQIKHKKENSSYWGRTRKSRKEYRKIFRTAKNKLTGKYKLSDWKIWRSNKSKLKWGRTRLFNRL